MRPGKRAGARIMGRRRVAVGRTSSNDVKILRVLRSAKSPMSAYAILGAVQNTRITAPTTVYRALSRLIADGAVHRLESLNAYVACRAPSIFTGQVFWRFVANVVMLMNWPRSMSFSDFIRMLHDRDSKSRRPRLSSRGVARYARKAKGQNDGRTNDTRCCLVRIPRCRKSTINDLLTDPKMADTAMK